MSTTTILDPLSQTSGSIPLSEYKKILEPHIGVIEYIDPYEQNEAFIINFPEHLNSEASHMEIHPCTIVSVVNGMIPFANFNQSPRNQLSCSQSKQGCMQLISRIGTITRRMSYVMEKLLLFAPWPTMFLVKAECHMDTI